MASSSSSAYAAMTLPVTPNSIDDRPLGENNNNDNVAIPPSCSHICNLTRADFCDSFLSGLRFGKHSNFQTPYFGTF